jgi:O-antigen/teichoic acid export membrane protein
MTASISDSGGSRRVVRGVTANAFAFASSTGLQLLMVPVLVHFWGLSLYGVWVIVSTIPSYLVLSNFGVAMVAGNEMAALIGAGNKARARVIYSTAIAAIVALSVAVLLIGAAVVALIPDKVMPADPHVAATDMRAAIMALVIYGVAVIAADLPMAKYRATGRYARGTSMMAGVLVAERLAVMGVAALGFVPAAVALAGMRVAGTVGMLLDVSRAEAELRPRLADASWAEAKRLAWLGSGMILFTLALAVNLQGPIVVLGAALAPAAVGLFSATRTLSRLGIQATGVVTASINAEFALVWGSQSIAGRRRLFAVNFAVSMAILAVGLVALLAFGQQVTRLWLVGIAQPSFALIALLAVAAALQGCWLATGSLILSANRQFAVTPMALILAVVAIAAGAVAAPRWGPEGMAAVLCGAEALMVAWVFRQAAKVGVGSVREAPGDAIAIVREWLDARRPRA